MGAATKSLRLYEPLIPVSVDGGGVGVNASTKRLLLKEVVSNTHEVQPVQIAASSKSLILEEV